MKTMKSAATHGPTEDELSAQLDTLRQADQAGTAPALAAAAAESLGTPEAIQAPSVLDKLAGRGSVLARLEEIRRGGAAVPEAMTVPPGLEALAGDMLVAGKER